MPQYSEDFTIMSVTMRMSEKRETIALEGSAIIRCSLLKSVEVRFNVFIALDVNM